MRRRRVVQAIATVTGALSLPGRWLRATAPLGSGEEATLRALAEVALPSELGADDRTQVIDRFVSWLRRFEPEADLGHGYGFTKLVRAALSSPDRKHAGQLAALDERARSLHGRGYAELPADTRRAVAAEALQASGVDELPARPDGGHVVSDLLAFYFRSSDANDLCYRAAIGRDLCSGLPDTVNPPSPLAGSRR